MLCAVALGVLGALAPAERREVVLVVPIGMEREDAVDREFLGVAEQAAKFHDAQRFSWDGGDTAPLVERLKSAQPQPTALLFVVRPERFDRTLHRRILLALCRLDDDPLVDATFGYLTARDGQALRALWERTEALHGKGLSSRTWHSAGVAGGMRSTIYGGHRTELEKSAGFTGDSYYFGCLEVDPDVRKFVEGALPKLAQAGVLEWSGNGDPQGIWLFDGARNLDRSKHWEYDPARVGADPEGAMPRITAELVRAMKLQRAVVWSGACHGAATGRIDLEGDIVSTFGRAAPGTVHQLPLEQSFGLALLDAGAAALLAPVGPNHGMSAMRESEFALREGASLGEAVKSSWDDVLLACGGDLRLDLRIDGVLVDAGEPIMQGGGANRVLLGDPTLRPFDATRDAREAVTVERGEQGRFRVQVEWKSGFHARAWDMYGADRERGFALPVRIDVGDLLPTSAKTVRCSVAVTDDKGAAVDFTFTHAVLEHFAGRRYLHLQANAPRALENRALRARFEVAALP